MITVYTDNGGLEIRGNDHQLLAGNIKTADSVAAALTDLNIDPDFDDIFFSSSMDFAAEDGFDSNAGAKVLWEQGIQRWYTENNC